MKYKIEKVENAKFIIHFSVEVESIIRRISDETKEDFEGMTPMGMVRGVRIILTPKSVLEGIESLWPSSRYSIGIRIGKVFDNMKVIRNLMTKLDCDIDLDDDELDKSIEMVGESNTEFLSTLEEAINDISMGLGTKEKTPDEDLNF